MGGMQLFTVKREGGNSSCFTIPHNRLQAATQEEYPLFRSRLRILAPPLAIALLALAGCGGLTITQASTSQNGLEKTTLNVAVVPAVDSAGFFVALHEGLFKARGLTINYTPAVSSDEVIDQQVAGQYDITGGNYVSYIQHYVDQHQQLEIVAEGSVMQEGTQAIYTMPNSKIKTLAGLKGHVLGINAPLNINYLLAASVLTENGIKLSSVQFPHPADPVPDHGERTGGRESRRGGHARAVRHRRRAAVRRGHAVRPQPGRHRGVPDPGVRGHQGVGGSRTRTRSRRSSPPSPRGRRSPTPPGPRSSRSMESLKGPQNGEIPPIIASVMAVNIYPTAIDKVRIQRVADVMYQFGLLKSKFNVTPMIGP